MYLKNLNHFYEPLVSCPRCVSSKASGRISRIFHVRRTPILRLSPRPRATSGHMAVAVGGFFGGIDAFFSHSVRMDVECLVFAKFLEPSMANSCWPSRAPAKFISAQCWHGHCDSSQLVSETSRSIAGETAGGVMLSCST